MTGEDARNRSSRRALQRGVGLAAIVALCAAPAAYSANGPALDLGPAEPTLAGFPIDDLEAGGTLELPSNSRRLREDFRALLATPKTLGRRGWTRLGAGVALVGVVSLFDEEIRSAVRSGSTPDSRENARQIRPVGQELALAALGGAWLAGRVTGNERYKSMARDGVQASLFAAGLVAPLVKAITGRARPRNGDGSDRFGTPQESFPSGETTLAFSVASVVSAHSERKWVKALAWGLASSVAWQRMELDAHWASDVAAGALLGGAMGRWVVRRHRHELEDRQAWSITPLVGEGSAGVAVRWAP